MPEKTLAELLAVEQYLEKQLKKVRKQIVLSDEGCTCAYATENLTCEYLKLTDNGDCGVAKKCKRYGESIYRIPMCPIKERNFRDY